VRKLRKHTAEGEKEIADNINTGGRGKHRGDSPELVRGNSTSYLLRRLARSRPDILRRYRDGHFKSVRAAAIAAGIIKPLSLVDHARKLL
jgi:hypothetical protein